MFKLKDVASVGNDHDHDHDHDHDVFSFFLLPSSFFLLPLIPSGFSVVINLRGGILGGWRIHSQESFCFEFCPQR